MSRNCTASEELDIRFVSNFRFKYQYKIIVFLGEQKYIWFYQGFKAGLTPSSGQLYM